ncbi:hypothetical protein, partial [Shewanella sp. Isolate7]|uniref:hypothetical protein n=1 Tax=Shewanella sp. Isolate7 TaxID=2908528 RepID=UPI001EFCF331
MISRFFFVVGLILAFMWFLGVSSNFKSEGDFISDSVSIGGNVLFFIAPVLSFFVSQDILNMGSRCSISFYWLSVLVQSF